MDIEFRTEKEELTEKYFASKQELDQIRSDITLIKWSILSKAYKMGKKIWGPEFSVKKLSKDMDIPYTTVKRCLALDKANERSWQYVRSKELSAFKLAQILMTKNSAYQDELVDAVVKGELSTTQIKSLKINGMKDIKKLKHEKAVAEGYSRKDSAYVAMNNWLLRGERQLLMPISSYPKSKQEDVMKRLKKLKTMLNSYIKKYGDM